MFKLLAELFGYVLNFVYGIVNNYGLAIIIFTILLRVILLPINIKQQKMLKKSAKIQEKMKELQDKYGNDTIRLSQEVQELYKKENMSPFSGCLSSILQIFIVISMFMLVSKPLSYMRQIPADKIDEYKKQVESMENVQTSNYVEISIIRNLGATIEDANINMDFLGLDLSDIPSQNYSDVKVFIIPVLYVATSILSMKLTTATMNKKKEEKKESPIDKEDGKLVKVEKEPDEMEAMEAMNKNMRYMMPVMTVSIALIAPLGLALYWFMSNLLMIIERLIVNKCIKED